jgi:hypothetical protein
MEGSRGGPGLFACQFATRAVECDHGLGGSGEQELKGARAARVRS